MLDVTNIDDLRKILSDDECDFRYECGVSLPVRDVKLCDKQMIVSTCATHYAVVRCLPQLEQIREGLKAFDVLDLMKRSKGIRQLFVCGNTGKISSAAMFDLFQPTLSPYGSNSRGNEETTLYYWANYLDAVDGKLFV